MPKFKKNPNPIRQNFGVGVTENPDATSPSSSGFKMKYKHSAFPFKSSPAKQEVEEVPPHSHDDQATGPTGEITGSNTIGYIGNPLEDAMRQMRGRRTVEGQL